MRTSILHVFSPSPRIRGNNPLECLQIICAFADVFKSFGGFFFQARLASALAEEDYDEAAELDSQMTQARKLRLCVIL